MRKKQTKIVATISDLKCEPDFIKALHDAGVDVMRLNTAHQSPEESLKIINNIRKVSDRIAILIDTKGPEVRVGEVAGEIIFKKGNILRIAGSDRRLISTQERIYVNYGDFHEEIPTGAAIFIDDGKLELRVREKTKNDLICEAINDGIVRANKSVNVPSVSLELKTLSKKDREYVDFSIKHGVDFIAHSFVRNKEDILAIQKILDKSKSKIKIIAKIENTEGVKNLNEILDHAYGIMVARGDLGIEIAAEEIPLIQKEIIRKCITHHKPVIVATQMLQSMVKDPRPTRAEVSDVANAVIDGADAVMLSDESASGEHPIEAVEIMSRIVRRVESSNEKYASGWLTLPEHKNNPSNYLIKAAIQATRELDIKEIIMTASDGFEVDVLASHRGRVPVYVKCFDKMLARQLALTYGVSAHYVEKEESHEKLVTKLFRDLVKKGRLIASDKVIFLASDKEDGLESSFLEICEVGKYVGEKKAIK